MSEDTYMRLLDLSLVLVIAAALTWEVAPWFSKPSLVIGGGFAFFGHLWWVTKPRRPHD